MVDLTTLKERFTKPTTGVSATGNGLDVPAYLARYGIPVKDIKPHGTSMLHILEHCIFDQNHKDGEAAIGKTSDGKLFYQCFHDSCKGRIWKEARQIISGGDSLKNFMPQGSGLPVDHGGAAGSTEPDVWAYARSLFPRIPYPWDVWPFTLSEGFRQMGRAFATSPEPIPGAACAIVASLLGSTIEVSPKTSWKEPLIFWFGDIRPSGSGKTPAPRALCKVLYAAQREADEAYKAAYAFWELTKPKDRGPQPERARGYFMTGLTLEGVRVDHSGHGGAVAILDEVSALISMQNEYKKDGSDREAWLCLHDGNPARIVRAKETKTISNSRLSIFGGIQPGVWRKVFNGKDGVYLEDGTAFRMLLTYGGDAFYPQTAETWDHDNREHWEGLLRAAKEWADQGGTQILCLSEDAQALFFDWRNDLYGHLPHLPGQLKGFIPKAVGYALRLAGVLHCVHRFWVKDLPIDTLTTEDMERGIKAASFYLGQTVDAAYSLVSKDAVCIEEITPQTRHLAQVLESLRGEVDKGHLAIGFICDHFNETRPQVVEEVTSRLLGSMLRHTGLTIPDRTFNTNEKRGVRCLIWDEKLENFLEHVRHVRSSAITAMEPIFTADIENDMSATSAEISAGRTSGGHRRTLGGHEERPQSGMDTEKADKRTLRTSVEGENNADARSERQAIQNEGESYEW